MRYSIFFFWYEVNKIWYAVYTLSTFHFSISIINFKGSITITWLVATPLGSAVLFRERTDPKDGALREICI